MRLGACGRDEGGGGAEGQGEAIDDGEASGTIEVWAMGTEGDVLGDFVSDFSDANPDADVKVTAIPWEAAHDKIANAIASGETPDVTLVGTTWMGEFAESGGIDPTPEGLVDEADFFEGAWGSTEVGGTSYGVPWYVETRVLYYRTDLAKKAGWDEAPARLGRAEAVRHRPAGQGRRRVRHQPPRRWRRLVADLHAVRVVQRRASLTNEDGTEYTIDSPEMTEALEYYKTFFDDGLSSTALLDAGELESGFADGTFGSFISGPWHTGLVEDAGVEPGPVRRRAAARQGQRARHVVHRWWRPGRLQRLRQQGRRLEVRPVAERARDPAGVLRRGRRPARRKSAWDTGELADDPQLQVFGQQLESALAPPAVPTWEEVAAAVDSEIEKATKGDTDPADAVSAMQKQAASIGTGL